MRRALAANTGLAVLLWFFAAPFLHLHAAGSEDHHQSEADQDHDAIVHFHMPGHHVAQRDVAASATDDDEKPIDSLAVIQKHSSLLRLPVLIATRLEPALSAAHSTEEVVVPYTSRAHDPPDLPATSPRAPPA